jgi:hypothetical protein
MIVEGYTIDLYCDFPGCKVGFEPYGTAQFGGRNKAEAWICAKSAGWRRGHAGIYCPKHSTPAAAVKESP